MKALDLQDRLTLAGIALITIGCYQAWRPLAPLFLGCIFIAIAALQKPPQAGA
ncbi:MAG TPA: hypothetical protein VEU08_14600 [Vicinamibacterales bacterium]|nr:hypothetical protein [Vicinamibacterales bacterium]